MREWPVTSASASWQRDHLDLPGVRAASCVDCAWCPISYEGGARMIGMSDEPTVRTEHS